MIDYKHPTLIKHEKGEKNTYKHNIILTEQKNLHVFIDSVKKLCKKTW